MLNAFKYIDAPNDWFYSATFNYWQKTNGRVVCYVSELIFGYQVQLYVRGDIFFCELEARSSQKTKEGYLKMFEVAENWLEEYSHGDYELIRQDQFAIHNPNGVWINESHKKKYWIL